MSITAFLVSLLKGIGIGKRRRSSSYIRLAISRIALIPKAARNPQAGKLFLHFLLSETGQALLSQKGFFDITDPDIPDLFAQHQLRPPQLAFLRPIKVSPGLLAYLDRLKRRKILSQWQSALQSQLP